MSENLLIQVGSNTGNTSMNSGSPTTQRVGGDGTGVGSPSVVGQQVSTFSPGVQYNISSPAARSGSGIVMPDITTISPGAGRVGSPMSAVPEISISPTIKSNDHPKLISLGDEGGPNHPNPSRNNIASPSAMNPLSELSTIFSHSGTPTVEHLGLPHVPPTPSNSESIPFASYGIEFNSRDVTATPPNSQNGVNPMVLAKQLNTASQIASLFGPTPPTPSNSTSGARESTPPVTRANLGVPGQESTTPRLDFSNPVAPTPPNSGRVTMHPVPIETGGGHTSSGSGGLKGLDFAHLKDKLDVLEEKEHHEEKKDMNLDLWLVDLGSENDKLGSAIGDLLRGYKTVTNKKIKERVNSLNEKNQDLKRKLEESKKRIQQLEAENVEMVNKVKAAESQCEFLKMKTEQLEKRSEEKEKNNNNNIGIMEMAKNILKKGS